MSTTELENTQVHIIATLKAIAGEESRLAEMLSVLVSASRAEPGCIHYVLHVDTEHSGTFVIYEAWSSQAALDEHTTTAHFLSFVSAAESLCSKPTHLQTLKLIR
ncbi:putative quinol monooxygenase [Pseudomonas sp. KFB-139]|uniref:Quinol monooxygenase n=1 Tax=Pseudomonas serbiensis TaxID=3064350 RepID=A0ABT9CLC0_9PSED|nr:putative quinol monooxygenase [Pseudomonas sp. KFB-138]MDO7926278.1 putative quinol monooxygenase [Pseudomonas sp. KFB-138]